METAVVDGPTGGADQFAGSEGGITGQPDDCQHQRGGVVRPVWRVGCGDEADGAAAVRAAGQHGYFTRFSRPLGQAPAISLVSEVSENLSRSTVHVLSLEG
jgi:hypothetical protein